MAQKTSSEVNIIYLFMGIYSVMINWYYNHSVIDAFFSWVFWPFYILYSIITGHLSHGMWQIIPNSYFQ
jgi:succinate dehydrogenase hydrophobic anchor subunit